MIKIDLERFGTVSYTDSRLQEFCRHLQRTPEETLGENQKAKACAEAIIKETAIYDLLRNENEYSFGSMRFMSELMHFEAKIYEEVKAHLAGTTGRRP